MRSFATVFVVALPAVAQGEPVKIACVGDSITEGFLASSKAHAYPEQLQVLLDTHHGEGAYSVTNFGAGGATAQKNSDNPYWKRSQYTQFTSGTWDIVIIMLGTNDAKAGNWAKAGDQHLCGTYEAPELNCTFAKDYKALVDEALTLGTTSDGPVIYLVTPVPLMAPEYNMDPDIINTQFPKMMPLFQKDTPTNVRGPIDAFTGMGGVADWKTRFSADEETFYDCKKDDTNEPEQCRWYCDSQSCDHCHPNDNGYAHLAEVIYAGLDLGSPLIV